MTGTETEGFESESGQAPGGTWLTHSEAAEAIRLSDQEEAERYRAHARAEPDTDGMPPHDWNMPHDIRYEGVRSCPPNCPSRLWSERRGTIVPEDTLLPELPPMRRSARDQAVELLTPYMENEPGTRDGLFAWDVLEHITHQEQYMSARQRLDQATAAGVTP